MLVRVVFGGVALVAAFVAVALLRLMDGPVNLDFLGLPTAREFDMAGGKMKVSADHIYAEWGGLRYPMRVVFERLHVVEGNVEIAVAPRVALSFEPRSVVRGRLLPKSIVVERPTLDAAIDREGGMMKRIMATTESGSEGGILELLIEQLMADANHTSLLGQLDTVEVEHARITLRDVRSGVAWLAPDARASLKRDAAGVAIAADARFSNGGEPVDIALSGTYGRDRIWAEAKIDGLKPYMLADLSPDAAVLRGIDVALSGQLAIEAGGDGAVRTVAIDITGGEGTVHLPGLLPVTHRVRSVNAHASVDAGRHASRIDHIDVDFGTTKLSITGNGMKTEQGQVFAGRAELRGIPVGRLGDYWPIGVAPGGREWAIANLSGGSVNLAAEFGLATPGNDMSQIAVTRAAAFLDYRDMKVRYMPHMPELEGVSGTARSEGGTLHFDIAAGGAVGLRVTGGTIDLTNLDGAAAGPQIATMRLPVAGPAPAIMALLARPKLGLPRDALYDPKRVAGEVAVDLQLSFPLLNSLTVNEIDIKADAMLSAFSLRNAIGTVDFTDASGKVSYVASQLSVSGRGKLDGNPAEVSWREMFGSKVPFRQRYDLKGTLPAAIMVKAGFPSPEPYVSGPVGVVLSYQVQPNGVGEVVGKLDLRGAKAALAPLGWSKLAGSEGQAAFTLKLAPGAKMQSVDFDGRSNGLVAKGQLRFDGDGAVQQVALQQLAIGRTDVALDWKRVAGGVEIALRGPSLELDRVREAMRVREEQAAKAPASAAATTRTALSVQLGDFLVQRGSLGSINGRVVMNGDRIGLAELGLGGGKGSSVQIAPTGTGRRLAIYVPDFGLLMRTAGWLDGVGSGADLDIQGRFDDTSGPTALDGKVKVGPYRLEQVTPRADVGNLNSTIAGLNRAGNALQQFNGLDAKFLKVGDRIDVKEARTSGPSIGLTAAGTMDLAAETARLRGVIVPGFAINNLLSNVPLLGPLLTGGKDGGVFAFSYRLDGRFDDLKPDVSMLSAITPGALRELFTAPAETMRDTPAPPPPAPERN